MNVFIPSKEELDDAIYRAVKKVMLEELPGAIRKATREEWLTTKGVMKMLRCSRRHIQYLRDSNQLTFYQNGHTIRYRVEEVEAFLNGSRVEAYK